MTTRNRFGLALERLDPSQWSMFEQLASTFVAPEFPQLRTMSVPEGDGGRDGILFAPVGNETVVLQYSIREDWPVKIRATAKRLQDTAPSARVLIYVTNQVIGARADDLKADLQVKHNLYLDVRDHSWFLERQNRTIQQQVAAEEIAEAIVDPYLAGKGVIESKGRALSNLESRAALVYLGLQWEDDTREKGLTKLSFEAVVKSVLRETDPEHVMPRSTIHEGVQRIMPTHDPTVVALYADNALARMTKRAVRHYVGSDSFCLSNEERTRLRDRLADREERDATLTTEIARLVSSIANLMGDDALAEVARVRRVTERYLFALGEEFATTVTTGRMPMLAPLDIRDVVIKDVAEHPDPRPHIDDTVAVVTRLLERPGEVVQRYLRSIADSYTLLAFLKETPDVQAVVSKIFSHGEIWLDTSVLLPLIAEDLIETGNRRFSSMINAAVAAGMHLKITQGVLEELETHMKRSLSCASTHSTSRWEGSVPFLYSMYVVSGRSLDRFASWMEQFRGGVRPEQDVAEYLAENFEIKVGSLESAVDAAPQDLRIALHEIFAEIHETRRRRFGNIGLDSMTLSRLAQHDVENYLGVMWQRRSEELPSLGYKAWWLTLDRSAYRVHEKLAGRVVDRIPDAPIMSPDFLVNYLALGPIRRAVPKDVESNLPLLTSGIGEFLPAELLATAEQIRRESSDVPESIRRRRVRDGLDQAKRRFGKLADGGIKVMEEEIGAELQRDNKDGSKQVS